ncbi:MAG TPA: hypothetical protein PK344_08735 [Syntrophorhabdaceae bacterium]|nr:hypothetical protein [Syntrophorhabdaceae bacterium]
MAWYILFPSFVTPKIFPIKQIESLRLLPALEKRNMQRKEKIQPVIREKAAMPFILIRMIIQRKKPLAAMKSRIGWNMYWNYWKTPISYGRKEI